MSYAIFILRRAQKEMAKLSPEVYGRIKEAIWNLKDNARPTISKKLTGREGWCIRIGNYRVIYEIDDINRIITILHVGHRRDVYRF